MLPFFDKFRFLSIAGSGGSTCRRNALLWKGANATAEEPSNRQMDISYP